MYQVLDSIPLWGIFAVMGLLFLLAAEAGFRLGKYRARHGEAEISHANAIIAATLALMAFMLAFTFGMGGSRFDARRHLVVEESNAVGTAYLRTAMLPEPERTEIRNLLREYVEVRIKIVRNLNGYGARGLARSEELHGLLWNHAAALGREHDRSVAIGLFIESLNEVIDLHSKRVAAGLVDRIPAIIWITLFFIGILGTTVIGYRAGLTGHRGLPATLALILAFSAVMILIMDLDRPGQSLFEVSQGSMAQLLESMNPPPAGVPE
ncbi:hypothetical protein ACFL2Z_01105 [Candidatus Eisenbacteria bacterium]|uniref:DUF4239 domain-containing protein n=1 Tax=Eiseniibacteriota bacterium TaxID=2212470 RepID=A0ABV6YNJ0_UNCEI